MNFWAVVFSFLFGLPYLGYYVLKSFDKIKSNKRIGIFDIVGIAALMVCIFLSSLGFGFESTDRAILWMIIVITLIIVYIISILAKILKKKYRLIECSFNYIPCTAFLVTAVLQKDIWLTAGSMLLLICVYGREIY